MVSLASRLPDIELLPGDGPPRAAPPPPVPPWRAPPPPDIERIPAAGERPRGRLRRPLGGRPSPGPRRTIWPQPARRPPAPAPRPAVALAPAAAVELEVPAFLARPRAAAPPLAPAPAPARARPRRPVARPRWGRIAGTAAAVAGLAAAALIGLGGSGGSPSDPPALLAPSPVPPLTAAAAAEIPGTYLALYRQFGLEMDIDWRFLAAIGGQESDHGRNPWAARVNAEGCVGPMQLGVGGRCGDFVAAWGVDGDGDGAVDPLAPADAIATAARGLRDGKGAPPRGGDYEGYRRAACGYYGACADARADYADEVMARAVRYGFPEG